MILLRAPRAGSGKTHLLSRLQLELAATHRFVSLSLVEGSKIDGASVLEDFLRRLTPPLPAAAGITPLDLLTRRLFSLALEPMVRSGEVPCHDREGALNALRNRPVDTFDFHQPDAVTAQWSRENFEILGPRLAIELANRGGISGREAAFWVELLFRYATTPLEKTLRNNALFETIHSKNAALSPVGRIERLTSLLGLASLLERVVLVLDGAEGLSNQPDAALRVGNFLAGIRPETERVEVIVSLNRDVWESAFASDLPGGLRDRLCEVVVDLEPLGPDAVVDLLASRAPGQAAALRERLDPDPDGTFARDVIRGAAAVWDDHRSARPLPAPETLPPSVSPPDPSSGEGAKEEHSSIPAPDLHVLPTSPNPFEKSVPGPASPFQLAPAPLEAAPSAEEPAPQENLRVDSLLRPFRER